MWAKTIFAWILCSIAILPGVYSKFDGADAPTPAIVAIHTTAVAPKVVEAATPAKAVEVGTPTVEPHHVVPVDETTLEDHATPAHKVSDSTTADHSTPQDVAPVDEADYATPVADANNAAPVDEANDAVVVDEAYDTAPADEANDAAPADGVAQMDEANYPVSADDAAPADNFDDASTIFVEDNADHADARETRAFASLEISSIPMIVLISILVICGTILLEVTFLCIWMACQQDKNNHRKGDFSSDIKEL